MDKENFKNLPEKNKTVNNNEVKQKKCDWYLRKCKDRSFFMKCNFKGVCDYQKY